MPTPQEQRNLDLVLAYVAAVDAFDADAVARHLAPDAVQREFPNVMTPATRERDREAVVAATREAQFFLQSQRSEVVRAVASGDIVAVESVWTGVLKVELGPLQIGDSLRTYTASFFVVRGGAIVEQSVHHNVEAPAP